MFARNMCVEAVAGGDNVLVSLAEFIAANDEVCSPKLNAYTLKSLIELLQNVNRFWYARTVCPRLFLDF